MKRTPTFNTTSQNIQRSGQPESNYTLMSIYHSTSVKMVYFLMQSLHSSHHFTSLETSRLIVNILQMTMCDSM